MLFSDVSVALYMMHFSWHFPFRGQLTLTLQSHGGVCKVFDRVIPSNLLRLNDPDTPTLLNRSTGSRFSPDISFSPSSLALSCSWEVLQDLGSDHLPILLFVPLSPAYRPNERPPFFNFQKARWDDFASYFDFHCPSAEEYSSLSLSSAAALFTSLALNAAKSSIPFGRIKRPPKAW